VTQPGLVWLSSGSGSTDKSAIFPTLGERQLHNIDDSTSNLSSHGHRLRHLFDIRAIDILLFSMSR
jgi:hypothetical protein